MPLVGTSGHNLIPTVRQEMSASGITDGRRIRAAMELAGIDSFGELARRIDHDGLGERTLRKIADDNDATRSAQRLDLVAIADACGLPYEFFTIDFADLAATVPVSFVEDRLADLEGKMATLLKVPHHGSTQPDERAAEIAEAEVRQLREQRPEAGTKSGGGRRETPGR